MDILCSISRCHSVIPVAPAVEPPDFHRRVRQPGAAFLLTNPRPTSTAWRSHDYWRRALRDLLVDYRMICAYSGSWTYTNPGIRHSIRDCSVDHFVPKSLSPSQAYDWDNFRLARARLNNNKGDYTDVIDPFSLSDRWFVLDFSTFLIRPLIKLSRANKRRVQRTINRLRLNADDDYIHERIGVIRGYCVGSLSMTEIDRYWPFIAQEMDVQDFDTVFLPMMKSFFCSAS